MNRKGQLTSLLNPILLIIISFVFLLFLAGFWYGVSLFTAELDAVGVTNSGLNITDANQKTLGQIASALPVLKFLSIAMIFGMIMLSILAGFFAGNHPAFFILFVFVAVISVIFSVPISNAHDEILGQEIFGGILSNFTGTNFVFSNLPIWITIISFVGAIFALSGILKDKDLGGSPI